VPRNYTAARHELLNETNRDEVQADVLGVVGTDDLCRRRAALLRAVGRVRRNV